MYQFQYIIDSSIHYLIPKSDMWMTYHEGKEKVHGLTLYKGKGSSILERAAQW